jgi:predicted dithiol-disulfide oxidoreductase (DUF899 family)
MASPRMISPSPRSCIGVPLFSRSTALIPRKSAGKVFHTYSTHARGIDLLNTAYNYIDLTPKGRDEDGRTQFWVRRHDEYDKK